MLSRCQQVRSVTTRSRVVAWAIVALTFGSVNPCVSQDACGVAERSLRFTYKVTISGLSIDDQVRAWIPEPVEDPNQSVELVSRNLPGKQSQQRGAAIWQRNELFFCNRTVSSRPPGFAVLGYQAARIGSADFDAPTAKGHRGDQAAVLGREPIGARQRQDLESAERQRSADGSD